MNGPERFPCKPGDWVTDNVQIAKVKGVDWDGTEVVVDLVIYDRDGDKLGRTSPIMGGPRTFEPSCSWKFWHRIPAPDFPLRLVSTPIEGKAMNRLDWDYGTPLPELQWKKPVRRYRAVRVPDDRLRRALREIAEGHNDPRALAKEVLGK